MSRIADPDHERREQRHARAVEQARELVAAEVVGPEQVLERSAPAGGWRRPGRSGSCGASSGAASASDDDDDDDDEAGERRAVGDELAREAAAPDGDRPRREPLRLRRELGRRLHHATTGRCADSAMRGSRRW